MAKVSSLIEGLAGGEAGRYPVSEGFECSAKEFWNLFVGVKF